MALSILYNFRGCKGPSKGMCVGEARRMGALGPEVFYSSSNDFLVTRIWVTLSPSELPTCLDWPNRNSWNNSRCMATLCNHRRQWRKTPKQAQPDNRLFWILPSALPIQEDTWNGDGHCACECCSGSRGFSRQRKTWRLRANGNALPGASFFLVSKNLRCGYGYWQPGQHPASQCPHPTPVFLISQPFFFFF